MMTQISEENTPTPNEMGNVSETPQETTTPATPDSQEVEKEADLAQEPVAEETPKAEQDSTPATEKPSSDTEVSEAVADTVEAKAAEHIESEEDSLLEEEEAPAPDYAAMSKEELVKVAVEASGSDDIKKAGTVFKSIKPLFKNIYTEEYNQALQTYLDAEQGNTKEDFEYKDALKEQFYEAYAKYQSKRNLLNEQREAEKLKNLQAKRDILDKLKEITESDETEDSLNQVKELQAAWKKIRIVPQEFANELWDNYRVYLDKFYDNLSIYHELKDLDRKKNLDIKIDLCMKVDALQQEPSVKKALILLNKYHEDWKNTGPVPKESNDEIWERFKQASDKIYEIKRAHIAELEEKRAKNLEAKLDICEKTEAALADFEGKKPKDWIKKTEELNELFEAWKKIGPVPRKDNQDIWNRFRQSYNAFYHKKNDFFKAYNKEKAENLKVKVELCEKAEALQDSEDWNKTANALKQLQQQWKNAGPVQEKHSEKVWKRFRAACDTFFNRKSAHFADQNKEQKDNLEQKQALIGKLKELATKEDANIMDEVKALQESWNSIGFVPFSQKDKIQKEYKSLLDGFYDKFRQQVGKMNKAKLKSHFEGLAQSPDGSSKLRQEERFLKDKIRKIQAEVDTWQNNLGFFANSKGANELKDQFEEKIAKAQEQIDKLQDKIKILRSAAKTDNTATSS